VRWRLLALCESGSEAGGGDLPGPLNMGLDEVLLRGAVATGVPCLRFYTWDGPWLSVGYAQPFDASRLPALAAAGVGFVRRVTGGKAVLHGSDLTYSVAAPNGVLPDGVRESYEAIADALLAALGSLGVAATRSGEGARAPGPGVFDCFEAPAADEICLAGRKLSGSAQRRVGGGFLQHGSIRLRPDPPSAVAAVVPSGRGLGGTSLEEAGRPVSAAILAEACRAAFEDRFGARFEPDRISPPELREARRRGPHPRPGSHLWDATGARIPPES
jgi:lipoate-protein ligase A